MIENTNWIQVPNKFVFLDHNTHSRVLRISASPLEIYAISNISYSANYTTNGSPVTTNGAFTNSSATNYLTRDVGTVSYTTAELTLKLKKTSNVDSNYAFSSTANFCLGFNSSGQVTIWDSVTGDQTAGATVYSNNTKYWVRLVYTAGNLKVYVKQGTEAEELSDLPPVSDSSWSLQIDKSLTVEIFNEYTMRLGNNVNNTAQYFRGYIYLTGCALSLDGTQTWVASERTDGTYIQLSSWTWLNKEVYHVLSAAQTRKTPAQLISGSYPADLKGYLMMQQGATQPTLSALTTADVAVQSPLVYTGYSYYVSDTAGSGVTSLLKTGTRYRAFTKASAGGTDYMFAPASYFTTDVDRTIQGTYLRNANSATTAIPFRQFTRPSESYSYSAQDKTLTKAGDSSVVYTYNGVDVLIEASDLA